MKVSVIIPVYNNAARLRQLLAALGKQVVARVEVEIIVVDNGSSDACREVCDGPGVTYLNIDRPKNPYVCRNAGLRAATGSILALLDSTCIPLAHDYLERVCTKTETADLVVGNIQFELSDKPSVAQIADSILFIANGEGDSTRTDYPAGTLTFPRATLAKVGEFREDMRSGADGEWTRRVAGAGLSIRYDPEAVVMYPPKKLRALLRKAIRIGRGHHTLLVETGEFRPFQEILRMRPPSPKYLNQIIGDRGRPEFAQKRLQLTFVIWLYRIWLGVGRTFG